MFRERSGFAVSFQWRQTLTLLSAVKFQDTEHLLTSQSLNGLLLVLSFQLCFWSRRFCKQRKVPICYLHVILMHACTKTLGSPKSGEEMHKQKKCLSLLLTLTPCTLTHCIRVGWMFTDCGVRAVAFAGMGDHFSFLAIDIQPKSGVGDEMTLDIMVLVL